MDENGEWPCPYCGYNAWRVWTYGRKPTGIDLAECGHCHVLFTEHWVDGCWMGRMVEARWPGLLPDFVKMRSEALREQP